MGIDIKALLVKSVKQGASAGIIRGISKEVRGVIAEDYPAILLLPEDLQSIIACYVVHAVATAVPSLPGAAAAESIAENAMEGLVTNAVSVMMEGLIQRVGPKLAQIAMLSGEKIPKKLKGAE